MKKRQAKVSPSAQRRPDYRAEITPASPPQALFNTAMIEKIISEGPRGLRQSEESAHKIAQRLACQFDKKWNIDTPWLSTLNSRTRARTWALAWRPRFPSGLAMSHNGAFAARVAGISRVTALTHRQQDPDFAAQCKEAEEYAVDLLQGRAFQRALEGDLEPVYYMGVVVDYVRKFDSRLQVEMLRALRPNKFKTADVNVNVATRGDIFVLTEEQRHELQAINQRRLARRSMEESEHTPALGPPVAASEAEGTPRSGHARESLGLG
jgi:hypothetical protein